MASHSTSARSHDENRHRVCAVCMEKGDCPISHAILERIKKYFIENFDVNDQCIPAAICSNCRSNLQKVDSGQKDTSILPDVFDFSLVKPAFEAQTREQKYLCDCIICNVARKSGTSAPKRKKGRPSITSTTNSTSFGSPSSVVVLCVQCKSPVARGISHKCNVASLRQNLITLCHGSDSRTQDIVASTIISDKAKVISSNIKYSSTALSLDTRGPNQLKLLVGKSTSSSPRSIASKDLSNLQLSLGASNYAMVHKVMPFLRSMLGNKIIESNTDVYMRKRDSDLQDLFSVQMAEFDGIQKPVAFCNDIPQLIEQICQKRYNDVSEDHLVLKLGLDGGGGYFKVCLTVYNRCTLEKKVSHSTDFLDTSVKRIIILAIIPDIKENYANVRSILDLLKIASLDFKYTFAVDLKLANIVVGIQAHGSSFPCAFCTCPKKNFGTDSEGMFTLRTIGSIKAEAERYYGCGDAKSCQSTTNPPIIAGNDKDMIIQLLPPPELHLMLRVVNKIFKHMESLSPTCAEICKSWIQMLGITRPKMHSGEFNGNMCRQILVRTDLLRSLCERNSCLELLPYCQLLQEFNKVRSSCFGQQLDDSFNMCIKSFEQLYRSLPISVTTAVHIVTKHLIQFCKLNRSSLGQFSEQASESVHSDFLSMYNSSGKVGAANENYGSSLLKAVIRYNGRHI